MLNKTVKSWQSFLPWLSTLTWELVLVMNRIFLIKSVYCERDIAIILNTTSLQNCSTLTKCSLHCLQIFSKSEYYYCRLWWWWVERWVLRSLHWMCCHELPAWWSQVSPLTLISLLPSRRWGAAHSRRCIPSSGGTWPRPRPTLPLPAPHPPLLRRLLLTSLSESAVCHPAPVMDHLLTSIPILWDKDHHQLQDQHHLHHH